MAAAEKSGSETTWSSSKSMATSVRRSLKSSDRNESKSSISAEYPSAPSLATGGAVPAAAAGLGRATTWLQTARTRFIAVTWRLVSAEGYCAGRRMRWCGCAVRGSRSLTGSGAAAASCHEMTSASRATFPLENTGGIFYIEFILLCPGKHDAVESARPSFIASVPPAVSSEEPTVIRGAAATTTLLCCCCTETRC
jgi:hypothetical protein